jgi:hypothetical protein
LRVFGHHSAQRARLRFAGAFGGNSPGALVVVVRALSVAFSTPKWRIRLRNSPKPSESAWTKFFSLA